MKQIMCIKSDLCNKSFENRISFLVRAAAEPFPAQDDMHAA